MSDSRQEYKKRFDDRDAAISTAHRLNQDHSSTCCEAKWMIERWNDQYKVVRYHLDTPGTTQV